MLPLKSVPNYLDGYKQLLGLLKLNAPKPLCHITKFSKTSTRLWPQLPCPTAANRKASSSIHGGKLGTSIYNNQRKSPPAPSYIPQWRAIPGVFKISLSVTAAAGGIAQMFSSLRHCFSGFRITFNTGCICTLFFFSFVIIFSLQFIDFETNWQRRKEKIHRGKGQRGIL